MVCAAAGVFRNTPAAAVVADELVDVALVVAVEDVVRLVVGLDVVVLVLEDVVLVLDVPVPVADQSS